MIEAKALAVLSLLARTCRDRLSRIGVFARMRRIAAESPSGESLVDHERFRRDGDHGRRARCSGISAVAADERSCPASPSRSRRKPA